MQHFLERYRHLSLLVAVLLAQLFFLAFQAKTRNEVRLIRVWAAAAVSPVQKLLNWSVDAAGGVVLDYLLLYDVRQENLSLKTDLEDARIQIQQLEAQASEAGRLQALLGFKQDYQAAPLIAAEVIGTSPTGAVRTVMINRGKSDGLEVNMAVLTPEGLVGKLVAVHSDTAVVLLLTDPKSAVGVVTSDTRVHGILKGNGSQACEMAYVPSEEDIEAGTLLLTSGQDQIHPKGLPVGRVVTAERGDRERNEFFWTIEVEPAVRLSRLEQVLILAGPPESFTVAASPARQEGPPRALPGSGEN